MDPSDFFLLCLSEGVWVESYYTERNISRNGRESPFSPVQVTTVVCVPTGPLATNVERDPGSLLPSLPRVDPVKFLCVGVCVPFPLP